jgi:hypothetical protein
LQKGEIEMKKELCSYTALIAFLSLAVLLTLATFVQANPIVKWAGSVSFTLKLTTATEDTSGNRKLVTSNETFAGTMNFYWDADPNVTSPIPGPDGCTCELLGNDGTTFCFNEIMGEASFTKKSGKGSVVFVGTGSIATTVQEQNVTGIAYINGKGSWVTDSSGNPISISLGGAVGAAGSPDDEPNFVLSGTVPTTALAK